MTFPTKESLAAQSLPQLAVKIQELNAHKRGLLNRMAKRPTATVFLSMQDELARVTASTEAVREEITSRIAAL